MSNYRIKSAGNIRFRKWLLDKGITLTEFSKKVGVSHQYISKVLNGKTNVTDKVREIFSRGGYKLI